MTGEVLDRRPLISPLNPWRRELIYISFERGGPKDYENIKIFWIECKIAVNHGQ
jgi:hypothetical protein